QAANSIEQEEHQVPLGQLRRRALRLVLVALRLPRTIRFPTVLAHHGSPRVCVKEGWHTGKGIIALPLTHSNYGLTSWTDFFRGQAPRESIFSTLRDSLLRIFPEPPVFEEPFYLRVRDPIGRHTIYSILILLRDTTAIGVLLRDF